MGTVWLLPLMLMSSDSINISNGETTAVVSPEGGRLASLMIHGHEVLVTEGEKPTRWGSFPMIPWCGRLPGGVLRHSDTEYQFPLTNALHANHGQAHLLNWQVDSSELAMAKLSTRLGAPWVFGGLVRQRFELDDNSLLIEVQIEAEKFAMPVMAGWHPWFRRQLDEGGEAELRVTPGQRYELDEQMIPTGQLVPVGPQPWNDCFVGLASSPAIVWPGALKLTVESSFDHWVLFTEPTHALCIEPQSGPPNQLNDDPKLLSPGQRFNGWMRLTWSISA